MNVLSLFDGMSCGRIALDRLGIPVDKYYASEIDKYAIQVSEANYPDIIRLGDVCDVKAEDLPKIDLLIAGSPCQGFSFAGKQLAFDDPRSALFFEFVRLLKECKPKYFLLENVRMKKEFLDIISEQVGCEPIFINSALVSAQNRQRFYWTNIPGIEQPEQRGIVLRDILEKTPTDPTLMSDSFVARQKKNINGKCLVDQNKEKAASLSAMEYVKNGRQGDYLACDDEGVPQDNPSEFDKNLDKMTNKDGKAYCVTARYTAAEPENSMQRKQRTMVPVMQKPIKVGMNVEQVKVRKHEVDIPGLQQCILDHYAKSSKDKKQIAKDLNDKYSTVEHYFRKLGSNFFSIPSEEHWPQLKQILDITTDKFDAQIMEFEYRDGVFESTQRVYSDQGKSPTLTATNKEQMIETTTSDNGITNIKKGTSGKSWFFEQQTYSKDSKKTRSLKAGSGSGNIPKVIETHDKPIKVGNIYPSGGQNGNIFSADGKSPTLSAGQGKTGRGIGSNNSPKIETHDKPKKIHDIPRDILKDNERQRRVYAEEGKSPSLLARSDSPKIMKETHDTPKQVGVAVDINGHDQIKRVYSPDGKSSTLTTCGGGHREPKVVTGGAIRGRAYDKEGKRMDRDGKSVANKTTQMLELRKDDKSNAITTVGKDSLVVENEVYWRKLTPVECERLQTVPDNYTDCVSNTQRYKMLGNGWTIEVIAHIFKNMQLAEAGKELPRATGQQTLDL